jgi:amidase
MTRGPLIFAAELAARPDMPDPETMDPFVRALFEFGKMVQTSDYIQAVDGQHRMSRELVAFFDTYDVLLTPTVGRPPPRIGELAGFDNIFQAMPILLSFTPFTDAWNVTGQPAVSLPLGMDEHNLPVGAQLVGRPADEATLIRVSAQVEQARPWADRRPPVS